MGHDDGIELLGVKIQNPESLTASKWPFSISERRGAMRTLIIGIILGSLLTATGASIATHRSGHEPFEPTYRQKLEDQKRLQQEFLKEQDELARRRPC